jgi:hypothetical protein
MFFLSTDYPADLNSVKVKRIPSTGSSAGVCNKSREASNEASALSKLVEETDSFREVLGPLLERRADVVGPVEEEGVESS